MRLRRGLLLSLSLTAALVVSALSVALLWSRVVATDQRQVASRLTDRELWKLSTDLSEQDGAFHSENLLSNEGRFYASNVEQYLYQNGIWDRFCASAATLPIDAKSVLIRSRRGGFRGAWAGGGPGPRGMFSSDAVPLQPEVSTCTAR
jgi:hypothetical protein